MVQNLYIFLFLFLLQACATPLPVEKTAEEVRLPVYGWLEHARLEKAAQHYFRAKLDPGAKTSSLHATNIKRFKRKGVSMVRFQFEEVDRVTGEKFSLEIERPVVRTVAIKRHKGRSLKRPVVKMEFYLGEQLHEAEFTLADRSRFHYPMLLGRRFLKDVALVDSGQTDLLGDPREESQEKR